MRKFTARNLQLGAAPQDAAQNAAQSASVVEPREHPAHHLERARLVERLGEVAALRRLHARRAARLARALGDKRVRIAHERLEAQEPLARDADPAGMAV